MDRFLVPIRQRQCATGGMIVYYTEIETKTNWYIYLTRMREEREICSKIMAVH